MKRWSNITWALIAVFALTATPAFAQGGGASSTGSISGDVKDAQGGVLPGVTVTATSPAQIGELSAVTNEAGIYRFPSVPPGEYKLTFELSGFQNVERTGIRVTLGFNAQINVQLGVASLQETITVSGESPVVDTSATRIQTNFDQTALSSIPNARDMWSLLAATPSVTLNRVDVGGSTWARRRLTSRTATPARTVRSSRASTPPRARRQPGSISTTGPSKRCSSARRPTPPKCRTRECSRSSSARAAATSSVNLYYDYENEDIQSQEPRRRPGDPDTAPAFGKMATVWQAPTTTSISVSAVPSHGIKVWGYFAYLNQQNSVAAPPTGSFLDGTPFDTKLFNHTGKGTYQLNQNNRFIGYLQHGTKQQPNRTDISTGWARPYTSRPTRRCCRIRRSGSTRASGTARSAQNMFAEFRAGQFGYNFGLISNTTDDTLRVDLHDQRGGGRGSRLAHQAAPRISTRARSASSRTTGSADRTTSRFGGEYLDERGNITWTQGYADSVIHFVRGSLKGRVGTRLTRSACTTTRARATTRSPPRACS